MTPAPDSVGDARCEERRAALRELLERQIEHEREVVRQGFSARDAELVKQAREYERRLDDLNHNLRLMLDDRKQFFTRDQHETFAQEYRAFRDSTNEALTTIQTRSITWTAAIGVAFALLTLALHYLR